MQKFKCYIVLVISLTFTARSQAQKTDYPLYSSIKMGQGFILPHHPEMKALILDHSLFYEFDVAFSTFGKQFWQRNYNYPKIGVHSSIIDYKNEAILGKSYQLAPYFSFPLASGSFGHLSFKTIWGLGYITKVFHKSANFKNIITSTHINVVAQGILQYQLKITPRFYWNGNLNFFHLSNGSIKKPNSGFNIIAASTGITYAFGEPKELVAKDSILEPYEPNWEKEVLLLLGTKEVYPIESGKNITGSVGYFMIRNINYKSAFRFGAEVFYNGGNYERIRIDNPEVRPLGALQIGIPVGYMLKIDRFSMSFAMGTYIYDQYSVSGRLYHRLGMRYQLKNNLSLYYNLKTHFAKADYFEVGMGYCLGKK